MTFKAIGILCTIGILAACSSVPKPADGDAALADEPQVYIVDGVEHTPAAMEELANRRAVLYYAVTPETFAQRQVHVFTKRRDYLNFKQSYKANHELTAQTSCLTDFDTKTSLYKNTSYSGSVLKLVKGSSYDKHDLGSFDQSISSVKGACNAWTELFDGWYFTGTTWLTFGTNYSSLPSWINNDASSVLVGY